MASGVVVDIEIDGLDNLVDNIDRAPAMISQVLHKAMKDATEMIITSKGLKRYPPQTSANQPPAPFYRRGRGLVGRSGQILFKSERLGTQFQSATKSRGLTIFGIARQRASYGQYVVGERQPLHMAQKGWKKMSVVVREKRRKIEAIIEFWVEKALRNLDLWP